MLVQTISLTVPPRWFAPLGFFASNLPVIQLRAHVGHWCQLNVSLAVETAATQTRTRLREL
jgi:hypothetical protein